MSLKCPSCGSRNTIVTSAENMEKVTHDDRFRTATSGVIDPRIILELLKLILKVLTRLFAFMEEREKNKGKVVVCKDCGYWKRI
ncbi:hypothetical protein EIL18_10390 [Salmonella enterica subsp. enterica]|nr:hypothetical protein [Salmonella enterica subsp. enterica]